MYHIRMSNASAIRAGVLFPTTEIGNDPVVIRDYAQTVEGLGYDHMLFFEHVLGANAESPQARASRGSTRRRTTSRSRCSGTWPRRPSR